MNVKQYVLVRCMQTLSTPIQVMMRVCSNPVKRWFLVTTMTQMLL